METACSPRSILLAKFQGVPGTKLGTWNSELPESDPGWNRTTDLLRVGEAPCRWATGSVSASARIRTWNTAFEARHDSVSPPKRCSAPARIRTWNVTFAKWHDSLSPPGQLAEGEGVEPSRPWERRVSSAAAVPVPHTLPARVESRGVEPRGRVCKTQPSPASVPIFGLMTPVGVEPTVLRLSTGSVYQFQHRVELQTWELNPASRLMRPGRAPARLQ